MDVYNRSRSNAVILAPGRFEGRRGDRTRLFFGPRRSKGVQRATVTQT